MTIYFDIRGWFATWMRNKYRAIIHIPTIYIPSSIQYSRSCQWAIVIARLTPTRQSHWFLATNCICMKSKSFNTRTVKISMFSKAWQMRYQFHEHKRISRLSLRIVDFQFSQIYRLTGKQFSSSRFIAWNSCANTFRLNWNFNLRRKSFEFASVDWQRNG